MKKVLIVSSTHGHEKIGQRVSEELKKILPQSSGVEFVIGNPRASEKNVAFVESDLNRIFPGNENGTYEERLAFELSKKILEFELVIDIHSTATTDYSNNSMLILTKLDNKTRELVEVINPPKVLLMKYKNDRALISQAKIGIAFEYGSDNSQLVLDALLHDIVNVLIYFGITETNPYKKLALDYKTETFEVYDAFEKTFKGVFTGNENLHNFQEVEKGASIGNTEDGLLVVTDDDFYPIMFGNNRYTTILGFKAKKL